VTQSLATSRALRLSLIDEAKGLSRYGSGSRSKRSIRQTAKETKGDGEKVEQKISCKEDEKGHQGTIY